MEKTICQHTLDNLRIAPNGEVFKDTAKFTDRNGTYCVEIESQSILHPNVKNINTVFSSSDELASSVRYGQLEQLFDKNN